MDFWVDLLCVNCVVGCGYGGLSPAENPVVLAVVLGMSPEP